MKGCLCVNGIMVELVLWSENQAISMDNIKRSIDIFPVEQETIGDIKRYGKAKKLQRIIETSSLLYSTGYIDTIEVEVAAKKMTSMLKQNLQNIVDAVDKYCLHAKFCIVINLSQKPIIALPSDFIQVMAKLSAELEFDSYVNYNRRGRVLKSWPRINIKNHFKSKEKQK